MKVTTPTPQPRRCQVARPTIFCRGELNMRRGAEDTETAAWGRRRRRERERACRCEFIIQTIHLASHRSRSGTLNTIGGGDGVE